MHSKTKIVSSACTNACGHMSHGDSITERPSGKISFVSTYLALALSVFKLGCLGLWLGLGW